MIVTRFINEISNKKMKKKNLHINKEKSITKVNYSKMVEKRFVLKKSKKKNEQKIQTQRKNTQVQIFKSKAPNLSSGKNSTEKMNNNNYL